MKKVSKPSSKSAKKVAASRPPSMGRRTSGAALPPADTTVARAAGQHPVPDLDSKHQSDLFEKAIHLFHKRDFGKAGTFFEKAAAGPVREVAHSARVHARICAQQTENASLKLSTAEDYYNYGIALLNRRDLDQACESLKRAAGLAPEQDHVFYALALCFGLKGDMDQAYSNLKRAVELDPRNRAQARNDPDFAEFVHRRPLEEFLFPERGAVA